MLGCAQGLDGQRRRTDKASEGRAIDTTSDICQGLG